MCVVYTTVLAVLLYVYIDVYLLSVYVMYKSIHVCKLYDFVLINWTEKLFGSICVADV